MRRKALFFVCAASLCPSPSWGGAILSSENRNFSANWLPAEIETRLDSNVYRAVTVGGIWSDLIYSLGGGGTLEGHGKDWKGLISYELGGDIYQTYSPLNNMKNNLGLRASLIFGELELAYSKGYFLRTSATDDFNYFDDDNLFEFAWIPAGVWNSTARFKSFSRQYFNESASVRSRNFTDQGGLLNIHREIDEHFSLEVSGSYNKRTFNRYAVGLNGGVFVNLPVLQADDTWTLHLGANFYFASVLQTVTLEGQRTDSDSYGFSNGARSASWAAVLNPAGNFYLQLFFRLYHKQYDVSPLALPTLQVGFIDDDSQNLLSIKQTWEISPQWTLNVSVSRLRNESDQPGLYYTKDLISAQIQTKF